MTILIGARDARQKFAELLGRVGFSGEVALIERSGRPMAALIPMKLYKQLIAEREARFAVIQRIQNAQPDLAPDTIEQDVTEMLKTVRAERAASGG
jgi:prevent-host-death family protein